MTDLRKGAWIGTCCLLALLAGSAPAWSQASLADFGGFFTLVENDTQTESLLRLEFLPAYTLAPWSPRSSGTTGRTGSSPARSSCGGHTDRDRLPVRGQKPYQVAQAAEARPRAPRAEPQPKYQCLITLLYSEPLVLNYQCIDRDGLNTSGRLTRLRK